MKIVVHTDKSPPLKGKSGVLID